MTEIIEQETKEKMQKSIDNLKNELKKIRSGKVTPSMLDDIKIEYYDNTVPLKQVANISAPESRLLVVHPWDKSVLNTIEKSIQKSDLGINPSNDGKVIRLNFPILTEDERKKLVKIIHQKGEEVKITIRNTRRDGNDEAKKAEKNSDISEDEMHTLIEKIQKITNEFTEKIDNIIKMKNSEIMEV